MSPKRNPEVYCGIATIHLIEDIELLRKCYSSGSFGLISSRMLVSMCNIMISAKEPEAFPRGMRCTCRILLRWRCLITRAFDFVGPLPSSYTNEYILVAVDYVSKWVEAVATQKDDAKTIVKFLKKNIFSHFGVPRVLISNGGSHFCNAQLQKVLGHYNVRHKVAFPYHPQTNGQVEVSNRELKKILNKTVAFSIKD